MPRQWFDDGICSRDEIRFEIFKTRRSILTKRSRSVYTFECSPRSTLTAGSSMLAVEKSRLIVNICRQR